MDLSIAFTACITFLKTFLSFYATFLTLISRCFPHLYSARQICYCGQYFFSPDKTTAITYGFEKYEA
jgi:hypothetical protein